MSKVNITLIKKGIVLFFLIILIFIPNKPIMKEYLAVTPSVEDSKPLISKVVPVFHPGKPYKRVYNKAPPAPVTNKIFPKTSQQSDELVLTKNIYWKQITFTTDGYSSNIPNHLICFEMNTQSLIQEICQPFSEEQIYFTEQDGSTVIPHWIAFGFGKMETRIWLKIHPKPDKKKLIIFVCFGPGVTPNQNRLQNITPFDPSLTAYFCFDDLINSNLVDLSGNQVKGTMSSIDYGCYWHNFGSETYGLSNRDLIMFNDWQGWRYGDTKSVYMTSVMPASNNFSNQGSIEINMSLYTVIENITQVFFTDHNHQLVLGLTPDERIFFQLGEDSNRITWNAKLEQATYHHVVITWDFPKKIIQLFVNGKPIKSLPSKTTFRFIQVHPVTSFLFGGIPDFKDKYGLSGFVEYVRIYHKPLNLAEAQQYRLINTKKNRFPYVSFGKLGVYKKGPVISKKINLNRPQQYPITENLKVNVIYSIPANSYYNFYYDDPDESYNSMDMTINTIDHLNEKPYPIFGFYSHFFQDIGTEITVKDNYLVQYVGLKINEPSLIKNLTIKFIWYEHDSEYSASSINDKHYDEDLWDSYSWLNWLIPSAKACGPFYSYRILDKSKMIYYCQAGEIAWFKLDEPIYITPSATVMQIDYHSTDNLGMIELQLKEILGLDQRGNITRATLFQEYPKELIDQTRGRDEEDFTICDQYKAKLPQTEKGSIELEVNPDNGLDIVFKNTGGEELTIDYMTARFVYVNLFSNLSIIDNRNNTILNVSTNHLLSMITSTTLQPGELVCYQLLSPQQTEINRIYSIVLKAPLDDYQTDSKPKKLISWIVGANPFQSSFNQRDEQYTLLRFWVDGVHRLHLSSPQKN